ncbi:endolytic transglycosylase MltG [Patescibacteria group bacterium]
MKKKVSGTIRFTIFMIVLIIGIVGSWIWWNEGISPVNSQNSVPVRFIIKNGETIRSIATRLEEQDLIRSSTAFFILVKVKKIDSKIQAGEFRLNQTMDANIIADELTHGIVDKWITTLEGWRVEEIAMKLSKELDIPEREFLNVAKEGYMFPDTYLVPKTASAAAIVAMLQNTFNEKITETMKRDVEKTGLTFDEVVILASIVEREGRSDIDRPMIAGILLNRLRADWPLQTDATVQYALGYQSRDKVWWKQNLTYDDLEINSSYNTYKYTGLPPAPISNPGLGSIRSVIYAEDSAYWYYLHDLQGNVHYAETLEGHNANIEAYLQ